MNTDRVDPSLGRVHLHNGPFSRSNTLDLRQHMNQVYKLAEQEHRETGRPLSECGNQYAHEIILDYLNRVYPRDNGQWIHRPNCGWYFETERSDSLGNSWSSSHSSKPIFNLNNPHDEELYLKSIKPQLTDNKSYAKNRRQNHFNKFTQNREEDEYSDSQYELSDDPSTLPQAEQGHGPEDENGIPSSAIQEMFQRMFS